MEQGKRMTQWRILLFLLSFTGWPVLGFACDVCGGSLSSAGIGLVPRYQNSFIGMRIQYRQFTSGSHIHQNQLDEASTERYSSIELMGKWAVRRNVHLYVFLPINHHERRQAATIDRLSGLGDASLLLNYVLFSQPVRSGRYQHLLQAGAGLKLPTGRCDAVRDKLMLNPNMQLGTGSWDGVMHILYAAGVGQSGFQLEGNYRYCTVNQLNYRFGNRASASATVFYSTSLKRVTLMPTVGCLFENAQPDCMQEELVDMSGGQSWQAQVGCQSIFNRVQVGIQGGLPLANNLSGGHVKPSPRWSAQLLYQFTKKSTPR